LVVCEKKIKAALRIYVYFIKRKVYFQVYYAYRALEKRDAHTGPKDNGFLQMHLCAALIFILYIMVLNSNSADSRNNELMADERAFIAAHDRPPHVGTKATFNCCLPIPGKSRPAVYSFYIW